jgi:hypothetical protein
MHEFMWHQVQLFSYLHGGYLHQTMEFSTAKEKSKQIFLTQPKAHQFKFAETNKVVPMDPLWLVDFFEQCQTVNKTTSDLDKLKEKKLSKGKNMAHPPVACSRDLNHRHYCRKNQD